MSDDLNGLTRRAVMRGAAVAGAASLARPAAGLGLAGKAPGVFSRTVGSLAGESGAIAAPQSFALVGVQWTAPQQATIELRTRRAGDGAWSRWATASVLGHGPDRPGPQTRSAQFGEAIWTGPADYVQLRSTGRVEGVRLHFVAATPAPHGQAATARAAQALPLAQPVLDAGPGQPPIIARGAWAQGHAPPSHVPLYGTVKLAFVHHSETPNGYSAAEVPSILRSIFVYHRYVRGYFDIAYNFAIDEFGRIWEARAGGVDLPVIGAHAGGYNQESTGMVVLGSFMNIVPSAAAIGALEQLLAWKLSLHGVPGARPRHRRGRPRRGVLHAVSPRGPRAAAAGRRAPRRRRDQLPRQRVLRPAPVDPAARGSARREPGEGHDRRSGGAGQRWRRRHRQRAAD